MNMAVVLAMLICIVMFFGSYIPINAQRAFYTISMLIKDVLLFIMPFAIFSLVLNSIVSVGKSAVYIVLTMIPTVLIFNFICINFCYLSDAVFLPYAGEIKFPHVEQNALEPFFQIKLPHLIESKYSLFAGILTGMASVYALTDKIFSLSSKLKSITDSFFNNFFLPAIPIFVLGFLIKMKYDGVLVTVAGKYPIIFLGMIVSMLLYLFLFYLVSAGFNIGKCTKYIKRMFPSGLISLSTASSLSAMPSIIKASSKNTENPEFVGITIPPALNIHSVGDTFSLITFYIAIHISTGNEFLELGQFFKFSVIACIAKLGSAGIPGGGALALVPFLESEFNFSSEMSVLLTSLYIMFDNIGTFGNVAGNGAFVVIYHKIYNKLMSKFSKTQNNVSN